MRIKNPPFSQVFLPTQFYWQSLACVFQATEAPGQPDSSGLELRPPPGSSRPDGTFPTVPHEGLMWWRLPRIPFLRKPAATDVYVILNLQLSSFSVRYCKRSHNLCATFKHFVSLSFPRNVAIFFLHLLPENEELGELPAQ